MPLPDESDTIPRIPDSDRAQQPDFSIPPLTVTDHDAAAEHHEKAAQHHRRVVKHQRAGQHAEANRHAALAAEHAAAASSMPPDK